MILWLIQIIVVYIAQSNLFGGQFDKLPQLTCRASFLCLVSLRCSPLLSRLRTLQDRTQPDWSCPCASDTGLSPWKRGVVGDKSIEWTHTQPGPVKAIEVFIDQPQHLTIKGGWLGLFTGWRMAREEGGGAAPLGCSSIWISCHLPALSCSVMSSRCRWPAWTPSLPSPPARTWVEGKCIKVVIKTPLLTWMAGWIVSSSSQCWCRPSLRCSRSWRAPWCRRRWRWAGHVEAGGLVALMEAAHGEELEGVNIVTNVQPAYQSGGLEWKHCGGPGVQKKQTLQIWFADLVFPWSQNRLTIYKKLLSTVIRVCHINLIINDASCQTLT